MSRPPSVPELSGGTGTVPGPAHLFHRSPDAVPPIAAPVRALPFDDEHAPIYTVGQVCGMLGVQPPFLRRLDAEEIVQPARSEGRQRRYSRQQILDIEHIVSLTGDGLTLAGVRRVLFLEAQVRELERRIAELDGTA